jgi:hypothetical protein
VYTSELEERFFANAKICDTDLVALLLNWPVDYKKVLVNPLLIARANRVFSKAMNATERELEGSPNPRTKKTARKNRPSSSGGDLLAMMFDGGGSDNEDEDSSSDDAETKTPMRMIDTLRALKGRAKEREMAKYSKDGKFSLLKFLSDERKPQKVAFTKGRRVLCDPAGQSVSESTFSIHAAFSDSRRMNMSPEHLGMMVKLNCNHDFLFHLIKGKIKARYFEKFGSDNLIA